MNRIVYAILVLITLFMLSNTVFAKPLVQSVSEPSVATFEAREGTVVIAALATEDTAVTEAAGIGTADGLAIRIVSEQLNNPLNGKVTVLVEVKFGNHYIPQTGPVSINTPTLVVENFQGDITFKTSTAHSIIEHHGKSVATFAKYYEYSWNTTNLDNDQYTLTVSTTGTNNGNNTTYTVTDSANVTLDNKSSSIYEPEEWTWEIDPNDTLGLDPNNLTPLLGWNPDPNNANNLLYIINADLELYYYSNDNTIRLFDKTNNQWTILYNPNSPNTNVNIVNDPLSDSDKQKLIQLLKNCYAYAVDFVGDEVIIRNPDGTEKERINLIDFCLNNSKLVSIGGGKSIVAVAGKLQPGELFYSQFQTSAELTEFYNNLPQNSPLEQIISSNLWIKAYLAKDFANFAKYGALLDAAVTGYQFESISQNALQNKTLATGQYVVCLVARTTANIEDYHWYRLDSNGTWSDKPGSTGAKNTMLIEHLYDAHPNGLIRSERLPITNPTSLSARSSRTLYYYAPNGTTILRGPIYEGLYNLEVGYYIVTPPNS